MRQHVDGVTLHPGQGITVQVRGETSPEGTIEERGADGVSLWDSQGNHLGLWDNVLAVVRWVAAHPWSLYHPVDAERIRTNLEG